MQTKEFKLGFKSFKPKDINKDIKQLSVESLGYPFVNSTENHFQWRDGWRKARTSYIQRIEKVNQKELARKIKKALREAGLILDKKYRNDLFVKFVDGSKAKVFVGFTKKTSDWNLPII